MEQTREQTCEERVDAIIHRYYHEHHNLNTYRQELAIAIRQAHTAGFMECKRAVVDGLAYRQDRTQQSLETMESVRKDPSGDPAFQDLKSRSGELSTLYSWVKGLVVKVKL